MRVIGPDELAGFEADTSRTLYVLDVRDPAEYAAGHRAGSLPAPGGQLVQATDGWIAVRGARIVLVCDTGVRSRMAAAWLRLMGHADVYVADAALGDARPGPGPVAAAWPRIGEAELRGRLGEPGLMMVDLGRSIDYRAGHVPGAVWGIRTRLDRLSAGLATARMVVVISPDGMLAGLALAELRALTRGEVRVLEGGSDAWKHAGGRWEADRTMPADAECVDFYLRPYDRNSGVEAAMQAYLDWEIDLVHEIERDGTVRFGAG